MTYTATKRFEDALKGVPEDRIPIVPLVGGWAAKNFSDFPLSKTAQDAQLIAGVQIRAMETVGYDAFFAYADALYVPEAFGCTIRFADTGPVAEPLPFSIDSVEKAENFPLPDPLKDKRLPMILEAVRLLHEYSRGDILLLSAVEGAFTTATRIFEAEHIMRMTHKNPQALEAFLDRLNSFLVEFARALIRNGVNVLFLADPSASSSMISPGMFRRFVLPRLKWFGEQLDIPCMLHICGDTFPILVPMKETGLEILSLDQCMDLSKARKEIPGVALGGNVDPINSLLLGTSKQVVQNTMECLKKGGKSQFVLMSGCGVPPGTTVENLKAMVDTAKDYGLGA